MNRGGKHSFGCSALCGVSAEQEACREEAEAARQRLLAGIREGGGGHSSLPVRWWRHASLSDDDEGSGSD